MKKQIKNTQGFSEERVEVKGNVASDLRGIGGAAFESFWKQLIVGSPKDAESQIFGKKLFSGELAEGEEISLKEDENKKVIAHKEYFRQIETNQINETAREMYTLEKRVQEIVIELKKLSQSSKEMQIVFRETTKEEMPVKPTNYHLHFFEWLLSTIRNARLRIEEGKNWLNLFSSKKAQRKYWSMFKKHGTSFGLSNERYTSTQTG